MNNQYVERVVDLTHPEKNIIYNMTDREARDLIKSGNCEAVRKIDGQFSLFSVEGKTIRMARSIGRPLRYFIAKLSAGPCLVLAERISEIHDYLVSEGLDDQFHPSYTRLVPAHYVTTIQLLGCPDPNPVYQRFFTPQRNQWTNKTLDEIGLAYMSILFDEIKKWLTNKATSGPVGISFSGGIDSGSVFLLTYHALLELGESPSRLKAFTLSVDGRGQDLEQASTFLEQTGLEVFHEPIAIDSDMLDWKQTIKTVEDYKPLDIQAATMGNALLHQIRNRYPQWVYMIDGDGGDENLKDYPIEENPELTIRSVLNNLMLYQEGWGVESIKHSLTYSGGLSRAYLRTYAPADQLGFQGFSPYTLPNVIEVAEGIPFIELTDWNQEKLYDLKGQIVSSGIKQLTGITMPVFKKRRFQHGAVKNGNEYEFFPKKDIAYRKAYQQLFE